MNKSVANGVIIANVKSLVPKNPKEDINEEYMWIVCFKVSEKVIELQKEGWIWCDEEDKFGRNVYLRKSRLNK